ncbi:MAG: DUF3888 domain-containing protein [Clostridium sp.]|nr:DUF3888 domain-containing protein [Clostridium sp.]MDY6227337.1 DUF3888 domain-containing protein [Clostridium sp.]
MKKLLFISLLLSNLLISFPLSTFAIKPIINAKQGLHSEYTPSEGSVKELYKDIIVTLLEPVISNEVTTNYGRPLQYDLFSIDFLRIERPNYRSFTHYFKSITIINTSIIIIGGININANISLPNLLAKLIVLPNPFFLSTDSEGSSGL